MEQVKTVIVGAGVSGLATAAFLAERGDHDHLVLERDPEVGGYCKTVRRAGFVWDYSGHFFHFKRPAIEQWLRARMPSSRVLTVHKRSFVSYAGRRVDFPFQKNIHQLPKDEFIDCLVDLYLAREPKVGAGHDPEEPRSFKEMLYRRYGKSIAEKFLIPYNEKLYACDLSTLDRDAMGRFFPHAELGDVIRNMRVPDNASYNATFTYPEGGAVEYVEALARTLPSSALGLNEPVVSIDLGARVARTPRREIRYQRLVSSVPFNRLLALAGVEHQSEVFGWNKVLVFNLGFDHKGPDDVHWLYFPSPELPFYRVGFYDNILGGERMSLYVELGYASDAQLDLGAARQRVLAGLAAAGIVTTQRLIAEHAVVMDPAYVHITRRSISAHAELSAQLAAQGVHSIGRYGGWTYCSIEDNLVEAQALAQRLS